MKEYTYIVKGEKYTVSINDIENRIAKVEVNGIPFEVEIDRPLNMHVSKPAIQKPVVQSTPRPEQAATSQAPATSPAQPTASAGKPLKAPLPGVVQDITVKVGDIVKKGDTVLILEAMKMANNITAESSGTITAINVNKDDSVMEGHTLMTIA
ncbi:MAG: biotin/lipoyl-binding protein [Bacteroidaceae bacterium]|nr:biotin/lipoyl-binding protein [Bacteroidaceae bacterium]